DWYADKPELRGCRCEHPSVALSPHWALNIDHPTVLEHYAELAEKLATLAPAVSHLTIQTNDSGAGINWCAGLYPGPNGPADTKDRDMGERVEGWFQAMRAGAARAGVELVIDFNPTHFVPDELRSTARALTASKLFVNSDDPVTLPFPGPRSTTFLEAVAGTDTGLIYNADVSNGYAWAGMIAPPQVFFAAEVLMELRKAGFRNLGSSYSSETPLSDAGSPVQMVFDRCVERCPQSLADIHDVVTSVAEAMVGRDHSRALVSAWRDVDTAIRSNRMDYAHNYYFFYGTIGRRWLTRPLVPKPDALTDDERGYWSQYIMGERDPELAFKNLLAEENRVMLEPNQYAPYYNGFEFMALYFDRAVRTLDEELQNADIASTAGRLLLDQRDRIEFFGCLFKNHLHVTGTQWVLDGFADNPNPHKASMKREKKRLYDMIDGEIANCERMLELMANAQAPLLAMGDEETYTLPRNVPEQLTLKIAVMRRHRSEVEEIFPGVGEWNFDKPTYSKSGDIITADDAELDD
ncbi:MAG: hypothetical protein O3A51_14585, partial [Verrucomicrobia bacterium]|nr:hypothetical protein [Verrucomicrobiota bacterium]